MSSAATQGVSVATGLQKSFSWVSVAVAGLSAGFTAAAGPGMSKIGIKGARGSAGYIANRAVSNVAGGVVAGLR